MATKQELIYALKDILDSSRVDIMHEIAAEVLEIPLEGTKELDFSNEDTPNKEDPFYSYKELSNS